MPFIYFTHKGIVEYPYSIPDVLAYNIDVSGGGNSPSELWQHFFGDQKFDDRCSVYKYLYENQLYIDKPFVETALNYEHGNQNKNYRRVMPSRETQHAYEFLSDPRKVTLIDYDINGCPYTINNPWYTASSVEEDKLFEESPEGMIFINPNTFDCWNDMVEDYAEYQDRYGEKKFNWKDVPRHNIWYKPLNVLLRHHFYIRNHTYQFITIDGAEITIPLNRYLATDIVTTRNSETFYFNIVAFKDSGETQLIPVSQKEIEKFKTFIEQLW